MDDGLSPKERNAVMLLDSDLIQGKDGGKNILNAHVFDAFFDKDKKRVAKVGLRSRCGARKRKKLTDDNCDSTNFLLLSINDEDKARRLLAEKQEFEFEICGQCVATFYSPNDED